MEWLTALYNLIMAEGKIPDCKYSVLLAGFNGKGNPMECGSYGASNLLEENAGKK